MSNPSAPLVDRNPLGQTRAEWLSHLGQIGAQHGFFERLGPDHLALFVQEGDVLVVSFDKAGRVFAQADDGMPLGFAAVKRRQWSLLNIMALRETGFRDEDLFDFFDGLSQQGFFDSFEQVIFLGFGALCGHAACSYSAAAPGSHVLATNPAATLLAERAGFDRRFRHLRGRDFSRYGDAPAALSTAGRAVIVYDPTDAPSAAHAGQFRGDAITQIPLRFAGPELHQLFNADATLVPMLRALLNGRLTRARVANQVRPERRRVVSYLWRLAQLAQRDGRFDRAAIVADYAAAATGEQRFSDLLRQLDPQMA